MSVVNELLAALKRNHKHRKPFTKKIKIVL